MTIQLDLTKYTAEEILASYQFIFAQYLGGQLTPPDILEKANSPSPYIFGEICTAMRKHYLQIEHADENDIIIVERQCVERLATFMGIPKEKLDKICSDFIDSIKKEKFNQLENNTN